MCIRDRASENAENILNQVQIENRNRYDYRKFLEKFAILKEEMQVDQDSFDYIFYNYGMEMYGNMPDVYKRQAMARLHVE